MSSVPASYMALMSKAIREELERHGRTLKDVPLDTLKEYVQIVGAFYLDMKEEVERRETPTSIREVTGG